MWCQTHGYFPIHKAWLIISHSQSILLGERKKGVNNMPMPLESLRSHTYAATCTCLHKQPPWLLQQLAVQCQWRHAEEATSRSECSCSGDDGSMKVRPHHAGALWTSLASSPSENQVQAGDDSLQVPTRIGANVLGGWLSAIAGKRHLRSACTGILSVPRTRTMLGMRSFAVAGPVIWNTLPAALWTATLFPLTLARHLKDHCSADRQRVWGPFMTCSTNLLIIIIIIITPQPEVKLVTSLVPSLLCYQTALDSQTMSNYKTSGSHFTFVTTVSCFWQ